MPRWAYCIRAWELRATARGLDTGLRLDDSAAAGYALKTRCSRSRRARLSSELMKSTKPMRMCDAGDSPGCTRALTNTTCTGIRLYTPCNQDQRSRMDVGERSRASLPVGERVWHCAGLGKQASDRLIARVGARRARDCDALHTPPLERECLQPHRCHVRAYHGGTAPMPTG